MNRVTGYCILAFAVICITFPVYAQWRGPILTRLGPAEGLPAIVEDISSDTTGYLYFATNIGLYRYDGHEFKLYSHDPDDSTSISDGDVTRLLAGRDGLIWLSSKFGGLNCFDPATETFRRFPIPALDIGSNPSAHALYETPDGSIWVGASHFRLLKLDKSSGTFTSYTPSWIDIEKTTSRQSILSITPDPHQPGTLWLSVLDYQPIGGTSDAYGLVKFNTRTQSFESTPHAGFIHHTDVDGKMWGKRWGNYIVRLDPKSANSDTFQHHLVHAGKSIDPITRDIISYQDRTLLVASSFAVMKFDGQQYSNWWTQDLQSELYCLYADNRDNLWVGTSQGALVLNPRNQHIRFFSLDQFGVFNRIIPGRLAFNKLTNEIYLSHTKSPNQTGFYSIPLGAHQNDAASFHPTSFPVEGMAIDRHDQLWAVGGGAIYKINTATRQSTRTQLTPATSPFGRMIYMESNAAGWIGMIGINEFVWFHEDDQRVHRIFLHQLPGNQKTKSTVNGFEGFTFNSTHAAYLYSNGVHKIDLNSGQITSLKFDPAINPPTHQVQYVAEDAKGNIWLSTNVHIGQYRLQEDSLVLLQSYGKQQGLLSAGARELHLDTAGRVWIFTASGLDAIDPVTSEVRFFGTKEGLPFPFLDPRQVLSIADGQITTVCHNGVIVFSSGDLWNSGEPPEQPIVWKRIRIDGEELATGAAINNLHFLELPSTNKGLDIEFQALAYPTDDQTEYSYRIGGLQESWISLGRNQLVTLPSLAPGSYTFEIKAGNAISHVPGKTLTIHVRTPLYQQAWFIIMMILLAAGGIYLLFRYRIRRVRHQEKERANINKKMAELELKALHSQMNPHFMFNSLNSIKNYILQAQPIVAAEYLSNFAHLIRLILQNSREKSITLKDELETLQLYIELEQIRFNDQFSFSCTIEDGLPMDQIHIPPMLLQPYIENAIWHGLMHKTEHGHLSLRFSKEANQVACIIDDDGVGRKKAAELKSLSAKRYKSMGMQITHDRIEIMNTLEALGISCEIIDKLTTTGSPAGTQVIVRIPAAIPQNQ